MKILTSYFYQIRFFKPNIIPVSTAIYDPKWYHHGYDKNNYYIDKNGVIIGLRADPFVPEQYGEEGKCVGYKNCDLSFNSCGFLKCYYNQLNKLNFDNIYSRFESLSERVKNYLKFDEEPVMVLIFHETPDNPCSERVVVHKWFKEKGIEIKEFDKKV